MKERDLKLSRSFVTGVVAFVFLILGYQTALFVHRAAVVKIAANRDEPDTVYVYADGGDGRISDVSSVEKYKEPSRNVAPEGRMTGMVRKDSQHHPVAVAVRKNLPRKNVETFRFDPNVVSEEDLCRLGFSQKQALSIVNYRRKGGRFRRKSDFARSYVVSDSIYRRLEPFIEIPLLDLNLADSAEFDSLPGVGGWFASRMVEYRKRLGGYSRPEQLLEIDRFDMQRYEALKDLITVSEENIRPYPFWRLPADSLRCHPYVADYQTARAIVLFRDNNHKDAWTVAALAEAGVISQEAASRLSLCVMEQPD